MAFHTLAQRSRDLVPYLCAGLDQRTCIDHPSYERPNVFAVTRPADRICSAQRRSWVVMMSRIREVGLQQLAKLIAMTGVHRHHHIVEQCKCKLVAKSAAKRGNRNILPFRPDATSL